MGKILIIHGPNLNMLGKRDTSVYGNKSLDEINGKIKEKAKKLNFNVEIFQSNCEGEIISRLHKSVEFNGVIINPGGYTHYSIAIRDAIEILSIPIIEVHLSNLYTREEFRHLSVVAPVCTGQISGFGYISYLTALETLYEILKEDKL